MKRSLTLTLLALLVTFALPWLLTTHAAATPSAPERRLQVSPVRTELNITPSTAHSGIVKFKNTGTEKLSVQLSAEAFSVNNETYDYTFEPSSDISNWVHFSSDLIDIEPGQIRPVQYAINVPIDAEPGGAYISLFGASLPSSDEGSIQSTERVGSLLYITVTGDVTKTGSLLGFSSPFAGFGETPWSARIHNTGSAHFIGDYTVSTKTLWGTTISEQSDAPLVMPNTIRLIQGALEPPQWLGVYIIHYNIALGDNGKAVGTRPYLYLPITQVTALIALVLAATLFLQAASKNRKENKKAKKSSH